VLQDAPHKFGIRVNVDSTIPELNGRDGRQPVDNGSQLELIVRSAGFDAGSLERKCPNPERPTSQFQIG
jgi:hypothetical protein